MNTVTTFKSLLKATAILGLLVGPQLVASEAQARETGNYVTPMGGALATDNLTAYSGALFCLADSSHRRGLAPPRVAVGRIADMTGKSSLDEGAKVTQGASLFAITALGKAGLPVVERLDSSVSEIELNYAKQHLLSDTPERAGIDPNNYRKTMAGQIAGSGFYIVGGVTELNNNIKSSGFQLVGSSLAGNTQNTSGQGQLTNRNYVLNIGVDLRLVNSLTQEVVKSVSYQKQILGYENEGALGGGKSRKLLSLTGGGSAIEPIQAGVRALIELGVYQLADYVYAGERGSGCMVDSSQKYSAAGDLSSAHAALASNDTRSTAPYSGPVYAAPERQYRNASGSEVQGPMNYQGVQANGGAPIYQAEAAPAPQYQPQYQTQAQDPAQYAPQYAPQYQGQSQGQYQDQPPALPQGQDLPRYLRDSWRR